MISTKGMKNFWEEYIYFIFDVTLTRYNSNCLTANRVFNTVNFGKKTKVVSFFWLSIKKIALVVLHFGNSKHDWILILAK